MSRTNVAMSTSVHVCCTKSALPSFHRPRAIVPSRFSSPLTPLSTLHVAKVRTSVAAFAAQGSRNKDVARNRRARFDYEIVDKIECGIVLTGPEVKMAREGRVSLQEAFCRVENGELWLRGASISINPNASNFDTHDPGRARKLLASKREINKLRVRQDEKGLTLVPLRMYFKENKWCKVEVAVGRGKKLYDKRESIKRRDEDRRLKRAVKVLS